MRNPAARLAARWRDADDEDKFAWLFAALLWGGVLGIGVLLVVLAETGVIPRSQP